LNKRVIRPINDIKLMRIVENKTNNIFSNIFFTIIYFIVNFEFIYTILGFPTVHWSFELTLS
jgi:hypothetical protein